MATAVTPETTQSANWSGSIPVVLTLAPSSLSSPTVPAPIHVPLSRHSYLHTGLQAAVQRLHQFAPTPMSFASGMIRSEPEPGSSSDDENDDAAAATPETKSAAAAAASSDTPGPHARENSTRTAKPSYPVCWFEDEETQMALRWHLFAGVLYDMKHTSSTRASLPWKIRLHFTAYPDSEILPLQADTSVETQVHNFYKNSLKQALCCLHGSSKVALNVTKESHSRLWRSVQTANFPLYRQVVNGDLPAVQSEVSLLPVRLYFNAKPPIQRPCRDASISLGFLLADWLPEHFEKQETDGDEPSTAVTAKSTSVCWRVAGIQPSLDHSVLDLWKTLSHPDHFLYLVVLSN